jgi:RimJ/RimL family protein N-acetyltransferase
MRIDEYLYNQMALEGIRVSGTNLITRAHPDVEEFPLALLVDIRNEKKLLFFDDTLPQILLEKLTAWHPETFGITSIVEEFRISGIETKVNSFRTYAFPENLVDREVENMKCSHRDDPKVTEFGFGGLGEKVHVIEQNGKIISACVSSRENEAAAESWVFTAPEHRRQGLALQVVTAWAGSVLRNGKIPFYSHAFENIASSKVAEKLRLIHLFDETVLEAQ